jgi:HlyD family secretion protein
VPVTTGITGSTDIEVTGGLKAGDEIIVGPYKVLRTLKNDVKLKRDNAAATQSTESS